MNNLQTIILAAGKGTRLNKGQSSPTAKVLYEIGGQPMIFYLLNTLAEIETKKPILIVGYKADEVKAAVGDRADYVLQAEQLGTGHAVSMVKEQATISSLNTMVLCGDMPLLSAVSLKKLYEFHKQEKAVISFLTVKFIDPNYHAFGRVVRDGQGKITQIVEQKNATEEQKKIQECNTGVYIFDTQFLLNNLVNIKRQSNGEYYLTDLVEIAISQGKKVVGVTSNNTKEFLGINTPEQLAEVERIIN